MANPRSAPPRAIASLLNGHNKLFINTLEGLALVLERWNFDSHLSHAMAEHEQMLEEAGDIVGRQLTAGDLRSNLRTAGETLLAKQVSESNVVRRVAAHPRLGLRRKVCSALKSQHEEDLEMDASPPTMLLPANGIRWLRAQFASMPWSAQRAPWHSITKTLLKMRSTRLTSRTRTGSPFSRTWAAWSASKNTSFLMIACSPLSPKALWGMFAS